MSKSVKLSLFRIQFFAFLFLLFATFGARNVNAQCAILPPILSLGSNKVPTGLCSPVTANLQYTVTFSAPLPAGNTYRVHFEWNDGQAPTESTVLLAAGSSNYNVNSNRTFPTNSDCEYQVRMIIRVNGAACASTIQFQRIASWRTDAFNGGNIRLVSPVSGTNIHEVCEGVATSVVFNDLSVFNCNSQYPVTYTPGGPFVETPNEQIRWQQITYNTPNGPPRIPQTRVNGVLITNPEPPGGDLIANYLDPRVSANENAFGVFRMTAPVVINDPRRRPTLTITAPGGFGAGFPDLGDEIEVTIRYWNFCNPYANDFDLTPVGGNNINGDNPPVEATAYIRIIDAPNAPGVTNLTLCETASDPSFNITATGVGTPPLTYTWYRDAALTQVLQGPSTDATFNPVTEGPAPRINKSVTGSQTFFRYVTVTSGAVGNCTSSPATITIQIDDTNTGGTIAHPLGASPIPICNTTDPATFTSTVAGTGGGPGGTFTYQWQNSTAVLGPYNNIGGATSVTFDPSIADITAGRFFRRRVRSGQCADVFSNVIEFRVDTPVNGGTIGNPQTLCAGVDNPAAMTNVASGSGGTGTTSYSWQISIDNFGADINTIPGAIAATYDPPAPLAVTSYYRRINTSGACVPTSAASNVVVMTVNQAVVPGSITNPQTICSGQDPAVLPEVTPPSGGNGTTYTFQWQESATGGGAGFAAAPGLNTGATYDPPVLTATRFYRRRVTSGVCPATFSNEIQITVNPLPTAANPTGGGAVCSGNPAPDIVWNLPTGSPNFTINYTITKNPGAIVTPVGPIVNATNVFTIVNPLPAGIAGDTFDYKLTSIVDGNGCVANGPALAAILSRQVSIGGTAPSFDSGPTLDISATCFNGGSTTDPSFSAPGLFSLDAGSASTGPFTLTYRVDGSANRTKVFNTNAAGDPTAAISFSDAELNTTAPSPHVIALISLLSPTGCQTVFAPINLNFTVHPLPVITVQPTNQTACAGLVANYSVTASAVGGVTFQWQERINAGVFANLADGTFGGITYSGATTNALTISNVSTVNTYQYRVIVTSTVGSCPVTSNTANLTVNPLPTANNQTPTVCSDSGGGTTATVDLTTNQVLINGAAGHTFSWFTAYDAMTKVFSGPIATPGSFVVTNAVPVFCRVTHTLTGCVSPATVTYTVNPKATITVQPPNRTVCVEDATTFTITAAGPGIALKWQENGVNITDGTFGGVTYAGSTTNTLTITNITSALNGRTYRAVTTTTGTCVLNSNNGTLTVNPLPTVNNLTPAVCSDVPGGTTRVTNLQTFNASISGVAGTTFTWFQTYTVATKTFSSPIGGAETAYNVTHGEQLFVQVVAPVTGCINVATVTFTVNPTPFANPITGPTNVCQDATSIVVYQVTPNAGATYSWNIPTGPGQFVLAAGGGPGDFFALLQFPNIVNPGQNITVIETIAGCPGAISTRNITVDGSPPAINIVGPAAVCSNETGVVYSVPLLANTTYAWTVPIGASIIGGQGTETITVNFGTFSGNVAVTPSTTSGCAGTPDSQPVVVNLRPDLSNTLDRAVCSGVNSGINFATEVFSPVPASTYDITSVTFSVPGLTPLVGPTSGSGLPFNAIFNDQYENKTGGPIQVRYTVVAVSIDGCEGLPAEIVTLTVNPEPVLSASLDKSICSRTASGISLVVATGSFPASTFDITTINNNGLVASAGAPTTGTGFGAAEIANDAWINTTGLPVDVEYTVIPVSAFPLSCPGDPVVIKLTVDAEPIVVPGQVKTICSGTSVDKEILMTPLNLPAGVVFNWPDPDGAGGPATAGVNVPMGFAGTLHITDVLTNFTGANTSVTYQVTPTSGAGCMTLPSVPIVITVEPQPIITAGQTKTICSGSAVNYHVNLTPAALPANTRYSWPDPDGAGPATAGVNVPELNANTLTDILTNNTGANITVTYNITPTVNSGLNCTTLPAVPVVITVEPQPIIAAGQTKTICGGTAVNYHVNLTPGTLPLNTRYSWPDPDGAGPATAGTNVPESNLNTITDILTNTTGANITVTYNITPTVNGGLNCTTLPPVAVVITVEPQPVIVPGQVKTICSGSAVNYHVNLTPATLPANTRYSWPDPDGAGPATAGVNVPELNPNTITDILTNTTGANITVTYNITPTVNGGLNCTILPAVPVVITVEPQPIIVAGQAKTICSGSAVNYHVNLTPASLPANTRYSWPDPDGAGPATAGVNVPELNANTITDILTNTSGADITVTYNITPTVNGGLNCTTLPAIPVVITVEPQPVIVPGQTKTICSGSAVNYHVNLMPASLPASTRYSWPDPDGAGPATSGTNVPESSLNTITDVLTNTTGSNITVTYNITPTVNGGLNCTTLPAVPVVITVEPQPIIAAGQAKTICSGSAVNYHVNLMPATLPLNTRYSWPDPDGAGPATSGTNVPESSLNTITDVLTNITGANITVTYNITPTVNSGLNCTTLPAVPVVITVEPQPIIVAGQVKTICSGSAVNYHVNLMPAALPANTRYNWPDPDGAGPATAGTNVPESSLNTITDVLTNTTGANITVTYNITPSVNSGLNCTTLPAVPVVITVEPQPIIAAGQTKTICSGSAVNYHVNLTPATLPLNTRYSWPDPDGAGPATAGTNVPESSLNTITDVLTNTTGANLTVTYDITPTVNSGLNCTTLPAVPVVITVEPQPIIVAGQTKTICSGSAVNYHVNLTPATLPVNTRYSWPDPDGAGPATAGTNVPESNLNTITDILTNTTGANITVTYTITPTVNSGLNCTTLPAVPVIITVEPQPVIVAGQAKTICSGSAVNYHVNLIPGGLPASTRYSWPDPDGAGPATAGFNIPESDAFTITNVLTNTTGVDVMVTYNITPTVNGGLNCTTLPPVPVVITVEPQPIIAAGQAKTICSGSSVNYHVDLTPAALPANTLYSWPDPDGAGPATAGTNVPESNLSTITDVLTNTTGSNITVTYNITPTVSTGLNCTTLPAVPVIITIEPQPIIAPAQVKTICSGSSVNYHVNLIPGTLPTNTRYSWPDPDGAGPATAGVNVPELNVNTITDILTNTTGANIIVTYNITPTVNGGLNCTTLPPVPVSITVEPQPVIAAGQVKTICSGSAVNYHVDLTPATLPLNTRYNWPDPDGIGPATAGVNVPESNLNTIIDVLTNTTGANITVTYNITPTVNSGLSCTTLPAVPVVITVEPQPIIVAGQAKTICSGSAVNYHVNLTPATLPVNTRYSWPDPDGAGPATAGVNVPELNANTITDVLTNTTGANITVTYNITPTVNSGLNCTTLPAVPVVITVEPQPIIAAGQTKTICSGSAVNYHVNLMPATLPSNTRYNWPDPDGAGPATAGVNISESSLNTITDVLTNTTGANITVTYNITPTVNGGLNCTTLPPVPVVITVEPQPIIVAGQVKTICSGSPVDYHVNLTPGALPANTRYSWPDPDGAGPATAGVNVPESSLNTITDVLTNTTGANITVTYNITPTVNGGLNCATLPAVPVVITVEPQPVIAAGQTKTICSGSAVNYHVNLTPASLPASTRYSWPDPDGAGPATAGVNVLESTPNTITDILTNTTGANITVTYNITPTVNAGLNCTTLPAVPVVITVEPQPIIVPGQIKTICSGDNVNYHVNLTPATLPANTRYSWALPTMSNGSVQGTVGTNVPESNAFTITDALVNLTGADITATYNIIPTVNNGLNCTTLPAVPVVITIRPQPVAQALTTIERCSSQLINFDIQDIINNVAPFVGGNSINSIFSYTVVADFPLDLAPVVFPGVFDRSVASNALITQTFSNYSNHDVTLTYTITPISDPENCTGAPFTLKVVIHPEPVGTNFTDPTCSSVLNHNIQSQITNPVPGLPSIFTYTVSSTDPVGVPPGPNRLVASNSLITDAYSNTTGVPVTITYLITPFNAAHPTCAGVPFTYAVTISPNPTGVSGAAPAACSDSPFSIDPQGSIVPPVASTFTWTATYDAPMVGPASGSGVINGSLHNETNAQLFAHYSITPTAGTCTGPIFVIDLPIDPEPVMDPILANPPVICSTNLSSSSITNVILDTNGASIDADSYTITAVKDFGLGGVPTTGTFAAVAGISNVIQNDTYSNTTAAQLKVIYTVTPKIGTCFGDPFDITIKVNPEPVLATPVWPAVCSNNVSSTNIVNITLGTNGVSVNAATYQLMARQFIPVVAGFTPDGGNAAVLGPPGGINLIRNDKYNNLSAVPVTVRYTIQGTSSAGCVSELLDYDVVINPEPTLSPGVATVCSGVALSGLTLGPAGGSAPITSFDLVQILITSPFVIPAGTNQAIGPITATSLQTDRFANTSNADQHVLYKIIPIAGTCRGVAQFVDVTINPAPDMPVLDAKTCNTANSGIVLMDSSPTSTTATSYDIISITPQNGFVTATGGITPIGITANVNEIADDQFNNASPTLDPLTVTYVVVPISGAGCRGPQKTIVLTVEPPIVATPVSINADICSSPFGSGTDITLISPSNPTPNQLVTFNYSMIAQAGISGNSSGTNLAENFRITDNLVNSTNDALTVNYKITPVASSANDGAGCIGVAADVFVIVEPRPKINNISNKIVCEGVPLGVALTSPTYPATPARIQFELQVTSNPGGVTGMTANGTLLANGSTLNDNLSNPTSSPQVVTYSLLPKSTGVPSCDGTALTFDVTVNPRPVYTTINVVDNDICSGTEAQIDVTADVSGTITQWTVGILPLPTSITGASIGSGDQVFQLLYNNGFVPATATYNFTPTANGCVGTPQSRVITVQAVPNITGVPSIEKICFGGTLNINPASNVAGTSFTYLADPNVFGIPVSGALPFSQVMNNPGTSLEVLSFTVVTAGPTGCPGAQKFLTVQAAPQMDIDFVNADTWLCLDRNRDFLSIELKGVSPFSFSFTDGTTPTNVTNAGVFKSFQITPATTTTYTITAMTDAFGCVNPGPFPDVTFTVGDTDPNFTLMDVTPSCSPFDADFQYNEVAGVNYNWNWTDGNEDIFTSVASQNGKIITHQFTNSSPTKKQKYSVRLETQLTDPNFVAIGGCLDNKVVPIEVYPTIFTNAFPRIDEVCSGENVQFVNQSLGVSASGHRWFYRVQGTTTPEIDVRTTPIVTYTMTNNTNTNPIIYEVVYQATNGNCPAAEVIMPIKVYRGITASFDEGTVPPLIGTSTVTFTNTSVPVDGGAFRYDWDFGLDATPGTLTNPIPGSVVYSSEGLKEITLLATNIIAEGAGLDCSSTFTKTINIPVLPLIADYDAEPVQACFPADIKITKNRSTGTADSWTLIDSKGKVIFKSTEFEPVFQISNPGKYVLRYTTSQPTTNQSTVAPPREFEIYGNPVASFDARPDVVFVPDTEVITFNYSTSATDYFWDFGDNGTSEEEAPTYVYKIEGVYDITLIAKNDHGNGVVCADTLKRQVIAKQGGVTKVPNAFTPNPSGSSGGSGGTPGQAGNGSFNDVFLPLVRGVEEFNMQVFDRWGNLIFESNNSTVGWDGYNTDGKLMPAGVYVYKLTLRLSDGQRTTQLGDITMIR